MGFDVTNTAVALQQFFGSFGIPAYGKNNVPYTVNENGEERRVEMPYITYEIINPQPFARAMFHAWVWYRGTSYVPVCAKCDEIEAALHDGGVCINTPSGAVYIMMDDATPFAQEQPDPDINVRVMYLTMILHADIY